MCVSNWNYIESSLKYFCSRKSATHTNTTNPVYLRREQLHLYQKPTTNSGTNGRSHRRQSIGHRKTANMFAMKVV